MMAEDGLLVQLPGLPLLDFPVMHRLLTVPEGLHTFLLHPFFLNLAAEVRYLTIDGLQLFLLLAEVLMLGRSKTIALPQHRSLVSTAVSIMRGTVYLFFDLGDDSLLPLLASKRERQLLLYLVDLVLPQLEHRLQRESERYSGHSFPFLVSER